MSAPEAPHGSSQHYLRDELYARVREDDEIFDFLQGGSLDGIWYWDLENPEHEWMSERFWQTFGHDPSMREHLAAEWQDMINPDDLRLALENFDQHAADASHPYDQIVRYTHKTGRTTWVRCRGMIIRDAQGKPRRMLGAHTDVTALKEAEISMAQKNRLLEAANRDLAELAYATSHDIKMPLRALGTLLDVLHDEADGVLSQEGSQTLSLARRATARLNGVVEGIISFAALTGEPPEASRFEVDDLVRDVLEDLQAQITESGVAVVVDTMPSIFARRPVLRQLLTNLIGNAIKFRRVEGPEHRVTLTSEVQAEAIRLSIRDNGIGIALEHQQRIFDAFKRLHAHGSFEGTGLGLAICRRCVALHDGDLQVESEPGRGSVFHVTIPQY